MDYLLYRSGGSSLKVAGSINGTLGPYEVHTDVVLRGSFWDPTIVKDVENKNDVLIFGRVENNGLTSVCAASLEWMSSWPVVTDFSGVQMRGMDRFLGVGFVNNSFSGRGGGLGVSSVLERSILVDNNLP